MLRLRSSMLSNGLSSNCKYILLLVGGMMNGYPSVKVSSPYSSDLSMSPMTLMFRVDRSTSSCVVPKLEIYSLIDRFICPLNAASLIASALASLYTDVVYVSNGAPGVGLIISTSCEAILMYSCLVLKILISIFSGDLRLGVDTSASES